MRGFKDSKKKFHPIKDYKGVRKSRDQSSKHIGIKISRNPKVSSKQLKGAPENIKICSTCEKSFDINKAKPDNFFDLPQCANCKQRDRKARAITKPKPLPDVFSRNENFSFTSEDGDIRLSLDDFGWRWSGDEDQINGFMARMSGTGDEAWLKLIADFEKVGITVDKLKPHLLKNLSGELTPDNDDGMYELSGDNRRWKFGEDDEFVIEGEFEHFNQEGELNDDEEEEFTNEFWNHYKSPTYEKWLEVRGNGFRESLKDKIKDARDFEELDDAYRETHDDIEDDFNEFLHNEAIGVASWDAVEAIKARRNQRGEQK